MVEQQLPCLNVFAIFSKKQQAFNASMAQIKFLHLKSDWKAEPSWRSKASTWQSQHDASDLYQPVSVTTDCAQQSEQHRASKPSPLQISLSSLECPARNSLLS